MRLQPQSAAALPIVLQILPGKFLVVGKRAGVCEPAGGDDGDAEGCLREIRGLHPATAGAFGRED